MEIQETIGEEKLVSVSIENSSREFCSGQKEGHTAVPGGELESREIFLQLGETAACV